MQRDFRFGVQQAQAGSRREWLDIARRAEDRGFSTLLVPDHFLGPFAPFVALTAAADTTSSLRLGTRVLANDFRNPLMLAREAASVDLLTDGRFELGLGAGWLPSDYTATGTHIDPPATRVARLDEAIGVIRSLLAGEPVDHRGPHYRIDQAGLRPRPKQEAIPIMVGGGSPNVLTLAGRVADIVSVHPCLRDGSRHPAIVTAASTESRIDWVRQGAADRFGEIELEVGIDVVCPTNDTSGALAEWSRRIGVPIAELEDMPNVLIGSPARIVETVCRRRERFGFTYLVFHGRDLDSAATVVDALSMN